MGWLVANLVALGLGSAVGFVTGVLWLKRSNENQIGPDVKEACLLLEKGEDPTETVEVAFSRALQTGAVYHNGHRVREATVAEVHAYSNAEAAGAAIRLRKASDEKIDQLLLDEGVLEARRY